MIKKIVFYLVLFLIALALRLPGISFHSLWFDETCSALSISQPVGDMLKVINTVEATPPLFFFLEKGFLQCFHLPMNEFSLRFLPVIFGAFSCILFFLIFKELPFQKLKYFAFFLLAFSNFHINLSQNARSYSFLIMMSLLTILCTIKWWKKPSSLWSLWSFMLWISIILTIQIHYYGALWSFSLCLSIFIIKFHDKRLWRYLGVVVSAVCLSFICLIPLFLVQLNYEIGPIKQYLMAKWIPGIIYSPIKVLLGAYLFKINTLRDLTAGDLLGVVPVLFILGITVFYFFRRMRQGIVSEPEKIITYSFIIAFCVHCILGWKFPTIHPQYMVHFLVLLFGCIMANIFSNRPLAISVFSLLIIFNCIANRNYYTYKKAYIEPWREIARTIDNNLYNKEKISEPVIGEFAVCLPIAFYLKNKSAVLYQTYSSYTPYQQNNFARLNAFGSTFYTELFHFNHFPVVKRTSLMEIFKTTQTGILVEKKTCPIETVTVRLNKLYKDTVDFSILNIYHTNQGEIGIIKWKCLIPGKTPEPSL
jgi:uncharacterized membrane protein